LRREPGEDGGWWSREKKVSRGVYADICEACDQRGWNGGDGGQPHRRVLARDPTMADPQTDVSRPSALPSAGLLHRHLAKPQQSQSEKSSSEYLDSIEEEWNKKVDMDVETLVDGMVDIVSLASVS
jgi:hypothetical protein